MRKERKNNMVQTLKELTKKSWEIYKSNFLKIVLIIFVIWLPLLLIQSFLVEPSFQLEETNAILADKSLVGTTAYENAAAVMVRASTIYMIATLVISFLGVVSDIFIIKMSDKATKSEYKTVTTSFSDLFSEAITFLPRCIWIVVLTALLTALGLMMFVLPGLYIYVMASLAVTAAVLAGVKGMRAIKLSFDVIKNEFFTILAVLLVFIIINTGVISVFDIIEKNLPDKLIISASLDTVILFLEKLITAFQIIAFTVFFNMRYKSINTEHPQDKAPGAEL